METELSLQIGKKIKALREAKGLTQAQLADILGKTVETVSNFERGQVQASVATLDNLAGHLGVPIKELFDDVPRAEVAAPSGSAQSVLNALNYLSEEDVEVLAGLARVLEERRRKG